MDNTNNIEKIVQWNINGLKYHFSDLQLLIQDTNPFCIVLQETHLSPQENFSFRNFKIFRRDETPVARTKGGVAIMLKDSLPVSSIPLITQLQAVAVRISFPLPVTICSIYLPDFNWTLQDLECLVKQLPEPFFLLGDFNSHNQLWGSNVTNVRGKIIETFLENSNLLFLNKGQPTFCRSHTFSSIDLSLCSSKLACRFSWSVLDSLYNSDHFPLEIKSILPSTTGSYPVRWNLKSANWDVYQNNFSNPTISSDINQSVQNFTECILRAAKVAIPKTSGKSRPCSVPWWNKELENIINDKKKAFYKFRKNPNDENLINFKKARALARQTIKLAKKSSWATYVSSISSTTSSSSVWKKVHSISGKRSNFTIHKLTLDNNNITEPIDIAYTLAKQFSSVSSSNNYSPEFQNKKAQLEVPLDFRSNKMVDYNKPFSLQELEIALNCKKDSSPGPDDISYSMIQHLPLSGRSQLLQLYNNIWQTGVYPDSWRQAIVVPIFKPGKDPLHPSSYRPISLTSCLSKILEKMINFRLIWYIEKNSLFASYQSGFRKFRSTQDNLSKLETAIHNNFLQKSHLSAIFFDIEKAYDMTWRYGIIKTLHKWGMRGSLPSFISSFLSSRTFRVRVANTLSDTFSLDNGVPQGSTLSVTLFSIAINNLASSLQPSVGRCLYVDDLVIYYAADSIEIVHDTLQNSINTLVKSADLCGFKFSHTKTTCLHFCRRRLCPGETEYSMKNDVIPCVDQIRFLGLIFDKKLSWVPHIKQLVNKCLKSLNIIKCLSNVYWGSDSKLLITLFQSLVLSKLDYGCAIYSSAHNSNLKLLDKILNSGLRYCTGAFRTSPANSLQVLTGLMPLNLRRDGFTMRYFYHALSTYHHPNRKIFTKIPYLYKYQQCTTHTRPVGVRAYELTQALDIPTPSFFKQSFIDTPPWLFTTPTVNLEFTQYKKQNLNCFLVNHLFNNIKIKYPNYQQIYTDGSKTENGVGCAVVVDQQEFTWRLSSLSSIYTAELFALWQALLICESSHHSSFIIYSDSLSSIQSISNIYSQDPLLHLIFSTLYKITNLGKNVIFCFVPSHLGIEGNDQADAAALLASGREIIDDDRIRPSDIKCFIKTSLKSFWHNIWSKTNSKLREIKSSVTSWFSSSSSTFSISRHHSVVLARLRIGHTRLTHSYLLTKSPSPLCSHCNSLLSVEHFLLSCPLYSSHRHLLDTSSGLSSCLQNSNQNAVQNLFRFLDANRLTNQL